MRIAKRLVWFMLATLAAGCHSPRPYTNSAQVVAAADYTTPEVVLTNSQPIVASEEAVRVSPSEIYAPNPTVDASNAKAPTQPVEPDSVLNAQIREKLNSDTDLAPIVAHVQIHSENGTVTLVGSVPDDEAKERIEAQINAIPGVVGIDDQLQAASATLPPPPPTSVASTPPVPVVPAPSEGAVVAVPPAPVLAPTATEPTRTNRVYASESASAAAAVPSSNYFNVHVQGPAGSDGTMAQRIIQELQADAALVPVLQTVDINVADGKITLSGQVQSVAQSQRVQAAVQKVTGINEVDNQLKVRTQ